MLVREIFSVSPKLGAKSPPMLGPKRVAREHAGNESAKMCLPFMFCIADRMKIAGEGERRTERERTP